MSDQPLRGRGGPGDAAHWDPAHFTWDPYEARAEPRSGSGSIGEPRGDGGHEGEGGPAGGGGGGGDGADPAAGTPAPPPGMEGVPSLDPSYDLTGVQKRSVPLVCQARAQRACRLDFKLRWSVKYPAIASRAFSARPAAATALSDFFLYIRCLFGDGSGFACKLLHPSCSARQRLMEAQVVFSRTH